MHWKPVHLQPFGISINIGGPDTWHWWSISFRHHPSLSILHSHHCLIFPKSCNAQPFSGSSIIKLKNPLPHLVDCTQRYIIIIMPMVLANNLKIRQTGPDGHYWIYAFFHSISLLFRIKWSPASQHCLIWLRFKLSVLRAEMIVDY